MNKQNDRTIQAMAQTADFPEGLDPSPEFIAKWHETREARALAAMLVEMREDAGLSQTELAKLMGKDQAFVSRMESATQQPKGATISLYAKHCGGKRVGYVIFEGNEDGDGITVHRMSEIGRDPETPDVASTLKGVSITC